MNNNAPYKNIFLAKSCEDTWSDYQYALSSARAKIWDWVCITASNEKQAEAYRTQINERMEDGYLPKRTKYAVISDPDGKRVGSGGATLNVLRHIRETSGETVADPLDGKILVIHSGGDSKRIPQYSACGKLFSPVPRLLPDGRRSTLFDELMITVAGLPSRMSGGMLVMSGDALLLFNSLQVDLKFTKGAVALSVKEPVEMGRNHGVFVCKSKLYVDKFLHKQSEKTLRELGAADNNGYVDLDTGAVWFESGILNDLFSLISNTGTADDEKFDRFVSESVRLNFYSDFLYPLAESALYDDYLHSEGELPINDGILQCKKLLWDVLHKYKLSLIRMSPAKFIHFGSTRELHQLVTEQISDYEFLNWNRNILTNIKSEKYAANNSFVSEDACIGENCYIEDCYVGENVTLGENAILSNVTLRNAVVPSGVVMHGVETDEGRYVVRIYGVKDNPKQTSEGSFLTGTLGGFITNSGLQNVETSVWNTEIYPVCDAIEEAVEYALIIYKISDGTVSEIELNRWRNAKKLSLEESFHQTDVYSIVRWRKRLENTVRAEKFIQSLKKRTDISGAITILSNGGGINEQMKLVFDKAAGYDYSVRMRIYQSLAYIAREKNISLPGMDYQSLEDMCYDALNKEINEAMRKSLPKSAKPVAFVRDEVAVELPVRVNLGGGWSDTPPYCTENGGTVLNAAVSLNGNLPVKIVIKKSSEKTVRLKSVDLDVVQEITDIDQIWDYSSLNDAFVIVKAALALTGITSPDAKSLNDVLNRLGGGIYMSISTDIPKGSGLGTSSILAGGCIKAISEAFGLDYDIDAIYSQVLCLEQMIKTGGGWQDQAGGLTIGIKLIKSHPGIVQKLNVEYVGMTEAAMRDLKERYVLVYSGQQRLAKNILREIMNKYMISDKQALDILDEIQRIAVLMKFELEKGDITGFARLLTQHFELSKQLDKGSSNTCIDQIFEVCGDLIDGNCICGAGGGGFLQIVLKKGVTKDTLRERLDHVFHDSGVEVWDCDFV